MEKGREGVQTVIITLIFLGILNRREITEGGKTCTTERALKGTFTIKGLRQ